jgi:hypothetical protein
MSASPGIAYYDPKTGTATLTTGEKISYAPPSPAASSSGSSSGGGSPFKNLPPSSYNPPALQPAPIPQPVPAKAAISTSTKTISRPQEGVVRITYANDATVKPSLRGKTVTYVDAGQGGEYMIEGTGAGQTYYDSQRKVAVINGQPMSVDLDYAQKQRADAAYTYETTISGAEPAGRVQDIERWGRSQGIKVLRTSTPEEVRKGVYKLQIVSDKPLLNDMGQWTPGVFPLVTRTDEQIRQERIGVQAAAATDIAMKNAGPIEMAGFALKTTLSPGGIEYMGATTMEALGQKPPRPSKDIVKEIHTEILTTNPNGVDFETAYHQSMAGMESSGSPMPSIQMAIAGGAVLGSGTAILGSTTAKTVLYGAGAALVGAEAVRIGSLVHEGRTSEAIGEAETLGFALAAGAAAYKSAASYMQNRAPKTVTVEFSGSRGISGTIQSPERTYSTGAFEITRGKLTGLKGRTSSMVDTETGAGEMIVDIPAQKVGNLKVKPQKITRFVEDAGQKQYGSDIVYRRIANSGRIEINEQPVKTVGPNKEITSLRENARVVRSTGQGDQVIIRQLEGVGEGSTAGKYGLAVVKEGPKAVVVEESVLSNKMFSKIDWVDVAKIKTADVGGIGKPEPYVRGGTPSKPSAGSSGGGVKIADTGELAKPAVKEMTAPAVPSGISKVSVEQGMRARIVAMPTLNQAKKSQTTSMDTALKSIQVPAMIRKTSEKTQGRSSAMAAVTVNAIAPRIGRVMDKLSRLSPAAVPDVMTTQRTTQRQIQAMDMPEPVVTRTATQTVPVPIDVMPSIPKVPGIAIPGMPLPFTMGPARTRKKNFGLGVIRNPVPDIDI